MEESDREVMIISAGGLEGTVSHPVGRVSDYRGTGDGETCLPYQLKNDQYLLSKVSASPVRVPPTKFLFPPHKSLSPQLLPEMEH